jgi:hypothetical protein
MAASTEHDAAFALEAAVLQDLAAARKQWVPLAASLHEFYVTKAWESRGNSSMTEWLAQPEIGIAYRTAKDMIDVYAELVVTRGVRPEELAMTDASKVAVVLPSLRAGTVTTGRALADCQVLTRTDLRELYRAGPDSPLDAGTEPELCVCGACGRRHRRKDGAS